jgi:hypothetical protein
MSFSVEEFQKLKRHLSEGALGIGFSLNPRIRIYINDNTPFESLPVCR